MIWLDVLFVLAIVAIAWMIRALYRQDHWRRRRPHKTPEEGGRSFGDTRHWGGWGRPGQ